MYNTTQSSSPILNSTLQIHLSIDCQFCDHLELVFRQGHFIPFNTLDVNEGVPAPVQIVR